MEELTIIEQIKAEIERLLTKWESADAMAEELLSFLSTLEESEKSCEGLEEEIEKEYTKLPPVLDLAKFEEYTIIKAFASHFYELGCRRTAEKYDEIEYNRQRAEEQGSEELEEEISKKYANDTTTMRTREQYAELARHFAQWGAEQARDQMMKEAVEAEYGYFSNASKTILPSGKLNINEGDKVRIIIVKEK